MTTLNLYQVDAFTSAVFGGNPAAICPLKEWLPDELMQNITIENNLSETAFFIPSKTTEADYDLRWFMPGGEVDLCGHATLATAYVIFEKLGFTKPRVTFSSRSGPLGVEQTDNGLLMSFPIWDVKETAPRADIESALGQAPSALYEGKYWMASFNSEAEIKALKPNFNALKAIDDIGFLIVTAPSDDPNVDFVSRFFCPQYGVDEDPVTGSAHCVLTPHWAQKLNKTKMHARQISARGGSLICEIKNDQVHITGQAALYLEGKIHVE